MWKIPCVSTFIASHCLLSQTQPEENRASPVNAYVSPGQALTAKLGPTPLKSRTKGRGPLRLGKTWRPASASTPNRFHRHAPFNLAGPTSQQHGSCGRTRGKAGRSAGRRAEPTRAATSPARPSCRTPQVRQPNLRPGPHRLPLPRRATTREDAQPRVARNAKAE